MCFYVYRSEYGLVCLFCQYKAHSHLVILRSQKTSYRIIFAGIRTHQFQSDANSPNFWFQGPLYSISESILSWMKSKLHLIMYALETIHLPFITDSLEISWKIGLALKLLETAWLEPLPAATMLARSYQQTYHANLIFWIKHQKQNTTKWN